MAWTATKTSKTTDLASGNVIVTIEYRDGDRVTTRKVNGDDLTEAKIANVAAIHIESLTTMDAAFAAITINEPVTPVKVDLTPEQVYRNAMSKLQLIELEIASKIIPADDPSYATALDEAKTAKAALETIEPKVK